MKTRTLPIWALALILPGLPVAGGCTEELSGVTNQTNSASPAAKSSALATTNAVPAQTNLAAEAQAPNSAPPDPAMQNQPPPHVMISSSLNEVVKMAQAGIDEGVMLSFVTNSAGTFNLGSDQIIYLNDLGLSSQVVTAMIQHDQMWSSGAGTLGASTVPSPLPPMPATASITQPAATADAPPGAAQYAPAAASTTQPPPSAMPAAPDQAPPPTVVNNNYFYDSLSPYGNWVNVDGYGWCWQPTATVINSDWRPYCDGGRWLYTDNGWYWASDYTWGGIAFHYGRWFSDPRWGWCWWPDTCWGPSWVTWRYGGDYCGWAPLPPCSYWSPGIGFSYYGGSVGLSFGFGLGYNCYSFVPWNHFYDAHPYRYALAGNQGARIYNNSTVVNNYINGNNNTIINDGIGVAKVTQFSRSEIRKVAVRDAPLAPGRALQADRVARENGKLVVYRPLAPVTAPSATHRDTRMPGATATAGRIAGAREELAPGSRPAASRGGPRLVQNPSPAPLGAAARKAASFPVRASVPVALTDPISRPQPIRMAPNTLEVQMMSRPGSPVSNSRQEATATTKAGATTVWQNDARSFVYRRQLAPANEVASTAPAPAQMAPTFDRPLPFARSVPEMDRSYRRDLPAESPASFARPYRPAALVPSAPAQPRYYAPPPSRVENYSAPPGRSSYSPPPASSAPQPRPSPSYSPSSGGRSGRSQSN